MTKKLLECNVDFSGDANSPVCRVGVVVSNLDEAPPALHGFMGAIDWAGNIFVGSVHRRDRLQSWLTHFALVLEFDNGNAGIRDLWLLERCVDGVTFQPLKGDDFHNNFHWTQWLPFDDHVLGGKGSGSMLCSIHSSEKQVKRESVWNFVHQQLGLSYNIVHKNCKHFAYDFFYYCLQDSWVKSIDFPAFTESVETGWVENRGW